MLFEQQIRGLSVKNPMATLIVQGIKTLEIRSFRTNYRGKLAICSSQQPIKDTSIYHPYFDHWDYCEDWLHLLDGHIIGTVDLVDCVPFTEFQQELDAMVDIETIRKIKDKQHFAWVLENPKLLNVPIPIKGQLGIFHLPTAERIYLEQMGYA